MKEFYSKVNNLPSNNFTFSTNLILSTISGALASYITSPLDLAKLHLQIQRRNMKFNEVALNSKLVFAKESFFRILQKIYANNGVRGLFRGSCARVLYYTPSTAVSMAIFEECRRIWATII